MKNRLLVVLSFLAFAGCTRPDGELTSKVTIKPPQNFFLGKSGVSAQGVALPAGKKACYGVEVTGPGIPLTTAGSSCVSTGVYAGFSESESLVLEVPRGASRQFKLFVHLVEPSESCPEYFPGFMTQAKAQKTYESGVTSNVLVEAPELSVTLQLDFPGIANHLLATGQVTCPGAALKGTLYSNGDVFDGSNALISSLSSPTTESFYLTGLADALGLGMITSGGMLNFTSGSSNVFPAEVYSVTRKPDIGNYYALLHSGQIVQVSPGSPGYLIPGTCPFKAVNCQVPVWMQSISAGMGEELFGLDHAGQVYSITTTGPEPTGTVVSEAVTQVSFY